MSFISVQMAKRMGSSAPIEEGLDKGITVRPPSTALLSVDSLDRTQVPGNQSSANFIINKTNSIFNGFFNRIAMNELVLDWCIPNVAAYFENNELTVTLTSGPVTNTITLADGHYLIADVLDSIVTQLNDAGAFGPGTFELQDASGNAWVAGTSYGTVFLATVGGGTFTIGASNLQAQLGLATGVAAANSFPVICPKLLPYYYIDFVSPQLTYNQDLKDNTTSSVARDVLYRWVFAYDNVAPPLDRYGYPILQGYKEFVTRRYLSYPKQILWNPKTPLGQLSFQVYTSNGDLLDPTAIGGEMEYQMSLLFSEN
jgi:hypothetical protein